jgi:hypothetical protein
MTKVHANTADDVRHIAGGVGSENHISRKSHVGGGAFTHGDLRRLSDDLLRGAGGCELGGQSAELFAPCGVGEHASKVTDGLRRPIGVIHEYRGSLPQADALLQDGAGEREAVGLAFVDEEDLIAARVVAGMPVKCGVCVVARSCGVLSWSAYWIAEVVACLNGAAAC